LRPTAEVIRALAVVSRSHPIVTAYIAEWAAKELSQLPYASGNSAVSQGRCQVLGELNKLLQDAPDLAANPNSGKPPSTHTG
jgi:hypothetical protein